MPDLPPWVCEGEIVTFSSGLTTTAMEIDILAVLLSDLYNLKSIFCETNENKHHVGKETNNLTLPFVLGSLLSSTPETESVQMLTCLYS